ncbi:hypothetical protein FA10DRAFT_261756 [Acaromyces ingoldii]|uniref:Branchpoint-bridging protein n=1 Tax=Acaromyces ingoldii TaxID=215250 RepID=A0A316YG28_9BASI|nr:hypothetical protein FA10DRAFT_261756 [Acaromyces ingoldii]PWN88367.1 hypothetical protein FA10DRAFT_261756 [Acaromyces ingoldii]
MGGRGGYGGGSGGFSGPPPGRSGGGGGYGGYNGSSGSGQGGRSSDDGMDIISRAVKPPRKRRSRWGDASEKVDLGVATAIGANVPQSQLDRYAISVRIEEIARKLRTGDFIPPERERSPSPPPTYDAQGRRTNTREVRYRNKLNEERLQLVEKQLKLDPNYRPPAEFYHLKRNMKPTEKVYLPIKEFPEINFFGLLVGPRGNSLKKMERESGAKISIRGKGSVKEGKGRAGGDEDEEEMHCVVAADDEAKVKKCVKLINLVIETAASTPEAQNDHKRNQLRELAALNGTLRDDENQICQNCGQKGHRKFECPEERNWTAHIEWPVLVQALLALRGPGLETANLTRSTPTSWLSLARVVRPVEEPRVQLVLVQLQAQEGRRQVPEALEAPEIPPWKDPSMWNQQGLGPRGPRMGGPQGPPGQQGWPQQGGYQQQQPGFGAAQGYGGQQGAGQWGQDAQQYGAAGYDQQQQQPDYRQAWEEYYKQQGYEPAAAAAAALAAASGQADASQQPQAQAQGGQDYSKEWEEYYRQQAAAAQQNGGATGA